MTRSNKSKQRVRPRVSNKSKQPSKEAVLDPFCGSGTIPLAAASLHRHGIGIELKPEYAALADERSEAHPSELAVSI